MKRSVLLIVFLFCTGLFAQNFSLKLLKTIGDERKNYTFFKIFTGVVSPDNEIYVGDTKGYFIAKYSFDGKFIKKVGSCGQGPEAMQAISNLKFFNGKLYFYDFFNRRVAVLDKNLKKTNYIKLYNDYFWFNMSIVDENKFVGDRPFTIEKQDKQIIVLDSKGELIKEFFGVTEFIPGLKAPGTLEKIGAMPLNSVYSGDRKELVISFAYPHNPINYYIYDLKGKQVRKFSFNAPKDYILNPIKRKYEFPQKGDKYLISTSLLIYKDYILSSVTYRENLGNDKTKDDNRLLIFDFNGKLLANIEKTKDIRFFNINKNGYLIGTCPDDEEPKVYIFQLQQN